MTYDTRLTRLEAMLDVAEKICKDKPSLYNLTYVEELSKAVKAALGKYCVSEGKLWYESLKLLDADDSSAPERVQWISNFGCKSLNFQIRSYVKDTDPRPFVEVIDSIQQLEFNLFDDILRLRMVDYIHNSFIYRNKYRETAEQLKRSWETICREMNDHLLRIQYIAQYVEALIRAFNEEMRKTYSEILYSIDKRGKGIASDDWKRKVGGAKDYIVDFSNRLQEKCGEAEGLFSRQQNVMEMFNKVIEGTKDFVKEYYPNKAKEDLDTVRNDDLRRNTSEDYQVFCRDTGDKGEAELKRFQEVWAEFYKNFAGKFINYLHNDSREELFKLRDRANHWQMVYRSIYDSQGLKDQLVAITTWSNAIFDSCRDYTYNDRGQLEIDFKCEMGTLEYAAKNIGQPLFDRFQTYLWEIYSGNALTEKLKFQ